LVTQSSHGARPVHLYECYIALWFSREVVAQSAARCRLRGRKEQVYHLLLLQVRASIVRPPIATPLRPPLQPEVHTPWWHPSFPSVHLGSTPLSAEPARGRLRGRKEQVYHLLLLQVRAPIVIYIYIYIFMYLYICVYIYIYYLFYLYIYVCVPAPRPQGASLPPPPLAGLISHKVFVKSFCKSRFPHKSVNLFFMSVIIKNTLTDLCGN